MDHQTTIQLIEDCLIEIANGHTEAALNLLMNFEGGKYRSKFSSFSNQLSRINREKANDTIDYSEYNRTVNRINNGLIKTLEEWKKNPSKGPKNPSRWRWIGLLVILILIAGFIAFNLNFKTQQPAETDKKEHCEGSDRAVYVANSGYLDGKEKEDEEWMFSRKLKSELIELNQTSVPIESTFEKIEDKVGVDSLFSVNQCLKSSLIINIYTYDKINNDCIVQIFTRNVVLNSDTLESGLLVQIKTPPQMEFDIKKNAALISKYIIPLINLYDGKTTLALEGFLELENSLSSTIGFNQQKAYVQFNLGNCYTELGRIAEARNKYQTAKTYGYSYYNDVVDHNLEALQSSEANQVQINGYKTIRFQDGKTWLAENLAIDVDDSWCYENNADYCAKYGRLYTFEAAKTACEKLGAGWRLPTDDEWKVLAEASGGYYDFEYSREIGDPRRGYQQLIDGGESGFAALLGGYRYSDGEFINLGRRGYYWSSTERDADLAWYYYFGGDGQRLYRDYYGKSLGFSCRCVKDN